MILSYQEIIYYKDIASRNVLDIEEIDVPKNLFWIRLIVLNFLILPENLKPHRLYKRIGARISVPFPNHIYTEYGFKTVDLALLLKMYNG